MKSIIGPSLLLGGIGSLLWSVFGGWSLLGFIGGIAQIFLGFVVYIKME
ncbi:MAG: hypothetical protein ACHQYP_10600 [Nitrospiria bacterium]